MVQMSTFQYIKHISRSQFASLLRYSFYKVNIENIYMASIINVNNNVSWKQHDRRRFICNECSTRKFSSQEHILCMVVVLTHVCMMNYGSMRRLQFKSMNGAYLSHVRVHSLVLSKCQDWFPRKLILFNTFNISLPYLKLFHIFVCRNSWDILSLKHFANKVK